MSNETNEILTIAGKRVVVRYIEHLSPCPRCVFYEEGCTCSEHCLKFDKGNGEGPYFVPAEESEPKNWPADKDNLVGKQAGESVDRWVVTNAFLHCEKAGKIVSEMYGDKFNNPCNRDKYIAFLGQVTLDDRFGELAGILQKYGAMPAPKEQPEADLEAEIKRMIYVPFYDLNGVAIKGATAYITVADVANIARHFAEWGAEHLKK